MNSTELEIMEKSKYLATLPKFRKGVIGLFEINDVQIVYNDYFESISVFDGTNEVLTADHDSVLRFIDGYWIDVINEQYRKYKQSEGGINKPTKGRGY